MEVLKKMELRASDLEASGVCSDAHMKRLIHQHGGPWQHQYGHTAKGDQTHEKKRLASSMIKKAEKAATTSTWGY